MDDLDRALSALHTLDPGCSREQWHEIGRAGGHQATPNTSQSTCNSTGIVSRVKAAIVTLAVWGWFPIGLAERINRMGGPRDE